MTNKDISIVIPTYNSEKTISKCLHAIKQQTLAPLEIIVVDDGSKDATVTLAKEDAIVISNTRSKGAAGARNAGAYIAKADIIAFTDSDCVLPEEWLANIACCFSDPAVGAVGGGYACGADNSFWQTFCCAELQFRRHGRSQQVQTLVANNFACRRSLFLQEQGFPEQYPVCEDMLLSYKISQKKKVIWLSDNGVQHRFKDTLKAYLKHQYYFGAESTRFFLLNPKLMIAGNHQGKRLHSAIILAFLFGLTVLISVGSILLGNFGLSKMLVGVFTFLLFSHFLLYVSFLHYLAKMKFPNLAKAYAVSLLRDLVCGISTFDGVCRTIKKLK